IIAIFSALFPLFQGHRNQKRFWTLFYLPAACFAISLPLIMMGGTVRPTLAVIVFCFGGYQLWRRKQNGWKFEAEETTP
ncbi:MAG: Tat pathway signal protein, partial [Rhodospirillales bacterium]|nr:Tat pathway signal protein [Rhodospirillales bacterium]